MNFFLEEAHKILCSRDEDLDFKEFYSFKPENQNGVPVYGVASYQEHTTVEFRWNIWQPR
jgi:hypothetical protein